MLPYTIAFIVNNFDKDEILEKKILEIGALNINGSLRPIFGLWKPSQYVGVDIQSGPGVDLICNAEDLEDTFGENSFDIVVSSDSLEHIKNWKKAVSNIKKVCKIGGKILISVPSIGFPYHSYPHDYWRYELEDVLNIFSDLNIEKFEKSYPYPGVLIKCVKPADFNEKNLDTIDLYSIENEKRP